MEDLIRQIQSNTVKYPELRIIVDQGENSGFTYRQFDEYANKSPQSCAAWVTAWRTAARTS